MADIAESDEVFDGIRPTFRMVLYMMKFEKGAVTVGGV